MNSLEKIIANLNPFAYYDANFSSGYDNINPIDMQLDTVKDLSNNSRDLKVVNDTTTGLSIPTANISQGGYVRRGSDGLCYIEYNGINQAHFSYIPVPNSSSFTYFIVMKAVDSRPSSPSYIMQWNGTSGRQLTSQILIGGASNRFIKLSIRNNTFSETARFNATYFTQNMTTPTFDNRIPHHNNDYDIFIVRVINAASLEVFTPNYLLSKQNTIYNTSNATNNGLFTTGRAYNDAGLNNTSSYGFGKSNFCQFSVYDKALSNEEIRQVQSYLKQKYNI